jgi:hypothetical protein
LDRLTAVLLLESTTVGGVATTTGEIVGGNIEGRLLGILLVRSSGEIVGGSIEGLLLGILLARSS